jgi:hypothetical protein
MKIIPAIFEKKEIRRLYDEKTETWLFSVVDIIQVLTQQPDFQVARKYWNKLKERLGKEGSQLVTNCHRLKLPASPIPGLSLLRQAQGRRGFGGQAEAGYTQSPYCVFL